MALRFPRSNLFWTGIWAGLVIYGFWLVSRFDLTAGNAARTPDRQPNAVATLAKPHWRLVLFAHPRCPCTWSSLVELKQLAALAPVPLDIRVCFVRPEDAAADWEHSSSWKLAEQIPDVRIECDVAGKAAQRFGARTSGHTYLCDAAGVIRFSGGITGSRGHAGDNPGRRQVLAVLAGEPFAPGQFPVFGCPLFSPTP